MTTRRPIATCSVCEKLIVIDIYDGKLIAHQASGKECPGSNTEGKIFPT